MLYACGNGFFSPFVGNPTTLESIKIFDYLLDHPDDEIIHVDMKYDNILLRSKFGQVLGCRFNGSGELLTNDRKMRRFPVPIMKNIKYCALGYKCSIFLDFEGNITWCLEGNVMKIDGSQVKETLNKVAIFGDIPFAIAKYRAYRVKSSNLVDCTTRGEHDYFINRGSMKFKYERKYGQLTISGSNIGEFFYEHHYKSVHFTCVHSKIVKVEASENHVVNFHFDNGITAFGKNQYGQLGLGGNYNHYYCYEEENDCYRTLQYDRDESMDVDVFAGPLCTVVVTFSNGRVAESHAKSLLESLICINKEILEEPSLDVYHPLIQIISPQLSALLKNQELMKMLSMEELNLCRELVIYICEMIPYLKSVDDSTGHERFHQEHFLSKYFNDIPSLVTFLFLLNDVQDCGISLKEAIFTKLSSFIMVENVMQIITQTSDYLSKKVLKNSHNSVLMLVVKKCIAFIKENYAPSRYLYGTNEKFVKLSGRIEESKIHSILFR